MKHHEYILAGDSWAWKGYTEENYDQDSLVTDQCLGDFFDINYRQCLTPGHGNLDILSRLKMMDLSPDCPIIWIYTEPGRDYGKVTNKSEFGWIESEGIFEIRKDLDREILSRIYQTLPNPIGFIGGLSDINVELVQSYGYSVLHPSWQQWIANRMQSQWFEFGWGASDIGWRVNYDQVTPSKAAVFAWDQQIKEWCWWADHGWFCHEHPSPRANFEFAKDLLPIVKEWLSKHG